ncbi:aspartate aminotransferase [Aspergillus nomiae NRRL 13137]|uniref:Aspartate aminotransferase n=1 Tax=Aspergillus nomiae NRRL (strain ATCC 15546 / NRRL 13137 / CBS 260.88 / M93) TaxID=1509407 RepID=A0A0L1JHK5_ASPN3|nr:aspartate aminotransferase [Aspergillus nomiae NRRL 13137]KNG90868.1 aspartate aminotransferase [Aspergillus nomiae NRRL 13137]
MNFQRSAIEIEAPEEIELPIVNNLSESAVADRTLEDLAIRVPRDLPLAYSQHYGSDRLRKLIAQRAGLDDSDILVVPGASTALFIVATALLSASDHLVVTRPNYASNLETPRAIGCKISYVDLEFEEQFRVNINCIKAAIQPNTKLISLTTPNNPTGACISGEDLKQIAELARRHGCQLLVDETYAELTYTERLPGCACLGTHVIGVGSMSKAFGVPGIRVGWISTKNRKLQETFLAAKEQISITVSVLDEYVAEQILEQCDSIIPIILEEMKRRRELVQDWVQSEDLVEWVYPQGGVMGFVRMVREPPGGTTAFYDRLLRDHQTYVGPGRWFERPDIYFRLGYGWPTAESLVNGLAAISKALRG